MGVSQDDMAARLHVTQQRVSDMEKSDVIPRADRLHQIAAAYEIEAATLFAWAAEASSDVARRARRETTELRRENERLFDELRTLQEKWSATVDRYADIADRQERALRALEVLADRVSPPADPLAEGSRGSRRTLA